MFKLRKKNNTRNFVTFTLLRLSLKILHIYMHQSIHNKYLVYIHNKSLFILICHFSFLTAWQFCKCTWFKKYNGIITELINII